MTARDKLPASASQQPSYPFGIKTIINGREVWTGFNGENDPYVFPDEEAAKQFMASAWPRAIPGMYWIEKF